MSQTMRSVCRQWLAALPDWAELAPRGRGVTTTVVTKALVGPTIKRKWEGSPSLPDVLSQGQRSRLDEMLAEYQGLFVSQLRLLRAAVDITVDMADDLEVSIRINDVADLLARCIRNAEEKGQQLTEVELEAAGSAVLRNSLAKERAMSEESFLDYRERWEQRWASRGVSSLSQYPYTKYLLGEDEQPPYLPPRRRPNDRENIFDGLGRSVYSRARVSASDPHVPGDPEQIVLREISRACGCLGLELEHGLVLLESLLLGLISSVGDTNDRRRLPRHDPDRSWRESQEPLRPQGSAPKMEGLPSAEHAHDDLAGFAQACMAKFTGAEQQGRYLRASGQIDRVHSHAMRRAWAECFAYERRDMPLMPNDAAIIVSSSIFLGIRSGEAAAKRLRALHETLTTVDAAADSDAVATAAVDAAEMNAEAFQRALAWLAANRKLALRIVSGDEQARPIYDQAAKELDLPGIDQLLSCYGNREPGE